MNVIISLHREYTRAMIEGRKNVEFRKGKLHIRPLSGLFVYCTGEKRFRIAAEIKKVYYGESDAIWKALKSKGIFPGIDEENYFKYVNPGQKVTALTMEHIYSFVGPTIAEMRSKFKDFRPPQRVIYGKPGKEDLFNYITTFF